MSDVVNGLVPPASLTSRLRWELTFRFWQRGWDNVSGRCWKRRVPMWTWVEYLSPRAKVSAVRTVFLVRLGCWSCLNFLIVLPLGSRRVSGPSYQWTDERPCHSPHFWYNNGQSKYHQTPAQVMQFTGLSSQSNYSSLFWNICTVPLPSLVWQLSQYWCS